MNKAIELLKDAKNNLVRSRCSFTSLNSPTGKGYSPHNHWPETDCCCSLCSTKIAENNVGQALAELEKQPEPKCKTCGGSGISKKCPQCGSILMLVSRDATCLLNEEQFQSTRAGDYYCSQCPDNNRGKSRMCYWWKKELPCPDCKPEPTEFEEWFANEYPLPPTIERGPVGRDFKTGCRKAWDKAQAELDRQTTENKRYRLALQNIAAGTIIANSIESMKATALQALNP